MRQLIFFCFKSTFKTKITIIKIICLTQNKNYICSSLTLHTNEANTQQLNDLTIQVRRDILRMVHAVNSGHPGGSLGWILVTLYQNLMERKEGLIWTE
jgi:transketolase